MMRRFATTFFVLILASCAYRDDVTAIHPHRESLLGPSKTTKTLYLHVKGKDGYFASRFEPVRYQLQDAGSWTAIHLPADMILPPGTLIIVDRIYLGANMSAGPHTSLVGRAFPRGQPSPVKISSFHESLQIDLVKWEHENGIFSTPKTTDYLKLTKDSSPPW